jgi:heat-inducible transcriptional repressor
VGAVSSPTIGRDVNVQAQPNLSQRQRDLLRLVVEEYVSTGEPVGSKSLVARGGLNVSSSTVRNELQELESLELLTHPHTSAGRVPTEGGYRFYVDELLRRLEPRPEAFPIAFADTRAEVDSALQQTTEMLSEVTSLLALVSAPALQTSSIRHVEVLLLQPEIVMVVVITSAGGVTKRLFTFGHAIDPGLAKWAREYLIERLGGMQLGARLLRYRFDDPSLTPNERGFLETLRPAFTDLVDGEEQHVFVGGAATLLGQARPEEIEACYRILDALERRAEILNVVQRSLDDRRPFVRVGVPTERGDLSDVALVGAPYGLASRSLGAVTLLGPLRMDYDQALRSVRAAAAELSRFVADVYQEN